jgi:hypothetical protein
MPVQGPTETTPVSQEPARAKVVSNTVVGKVKTYFEGLEKDARTYVQNSFPRPHVEPPGHPSDPAVADVKLVKDDGTEATYHADNGWTDQNASN